MTVPFSEIVNSGPNKQKRSSFRGKADLSLLWHVAFMVSEGHPSRERHRQFGVWAMKLRGRFVLGM